MNSDSQSKRTTFVLANDEALRSDCRRRPLRLPKPRLRTTEGAGQKGMRCSIARRMELIRGGGAGRSAGKREGAAAAPPRSAARICRLLGSRNVLSLHPILEHRQFLSQDLDLGLKRYHDVLLLGLNPAGVVGRLHTRCRGPAHGTCRRDEQDGSHCNQGSGQNGTRKGSLHDGDLRKCREWNPAREEPWRLLLGLASECPKRPRETVRNYRVKGYIFPSPPIPRSRCRAKAARL